MRASYALWLAAAAILVAACASPPLAPAAPAQMRLDEAVARGAALVRADELAGAAVQYEEALRIARSIDDTDAIAAHAINLSIVYQRLGRHDAARASLSLVLDDPRPRVPERRRVQAELRRAILELASRKVAAATASARRAQERCRAIDCTLEAAILNVQAHAALMDGDARESARLAQAAERAARGRADEVEAANALRTLGRARGALNDPDAAIAALEQALALDRAIADPRKIHADLLELERASAAKGDHAAAKSYAARALAVSGAADGSAPAGMGTARRTR